MTSVRWAKSRKLEALRGVRLLAACTQRELAEVAAMAVPATLPAGTVLTREGQNGGLAYVIETGRCDVKRRGRTVATLGPGDVVGELSLLDGGPRTATVVAATEVTVLEISNRDWQQLLRSAPRLRRSLLATLAGRIREVDRRAASRYV